MECLQNNLLNGLIERVILFAEHQPNITPSHKLEVRLIGRKATFQEMFNAVPDYNGVIIVANTDIHFNDTLNRAKEIPKGMCYALSRWDKRRDKLVPFHHLDSQDAWIIRNPNTVKCGDYSPGTPGCDNRLAEEIRESGYKVINPCKTIQAIHVHETGYRTYTPGVGTVHGQYYLPEPCHL